MQVHSGTLALKPAPSGAAFHIPDHKLLSKVG